jgi:Gpi18-like mannosyltransferase
VTAPTVDRSAGAPRWASSRGATTLIFAAWTAWVLVVAIVARAVLPVSDAAATGGGTWLPLSSWDALRYIHIAQHGYSGTVVNRAFFPLFPLTMAGVHDALTVSYALAGTIVAVLCTYGAVLLLRRLLACDLGAGEAGRYVWLLLAAPYAFILLAPYTEAALLVTSVGAMLAARRQRWWLAGLLAGLASACRLPGLIVAGALLVEYLDQVRRSEQRFGPDILWLGLAPLGAVAYFAWLATHGGVHTYQRAYDIGWPYRRFSLNIFKPLYDPILAHVFHSVTVPTTTLADGLGLLSFVATIVLLVWGWRPLRLSYRVFCLLSIIVPLLTSVVEGLGRYYLVIFPLVLSAARIAQAHPRLVRPAVVAGLVAQAALIAAFCTGHPGIV